MIAAISALALLPLSACSSDNSSSSSSSSSSSVSAAAQPVAQIDAITGKSTAVALDKGFTDALTTLGLTPGVLGTAALENGSVSFPITGGHVKYYTPGTVEPYVQGDINHNGSGLSLTAGPTTVQLNNFDIDPGASVLYGDVSVNGTSAATHALLFNLDGSTLKPLQTGADDTAILQGTRVLVSSDAAALLNKTFSTDAVKAGLLVGIATITLNTK
ncbi:hypothetical protein [Nocardia jejuensis]|uniref:hypothetical protein n=1 Tax=Nocardia jejuensis TaxID=328049 RepID=UPI001FE0E585|nr:hypothetical protein [Nocardia jejuensis]